MANSRIVLILIGVLLIVQAGTPSCSLGDEVKCTGKYKGGIKPTPHDLNEILKQHDAWVKDDGPFRLNDPKIANDPRRANLCGADLEHASLALAHLEGTHLNDADLTDVDLSYADLDFDPNSLPRVIPGIYSAENLKLVKCIDQPAGLVKLRSKFKEFGLRTQEDELTCAIRRSELSRKKNGIFVHSSFERAINYVFFDWTCEYGASPGQAFKIVSWLVIICIIGQAPSPLPGD